MTDARKFDELVSWHAKPVAGVGMGWDPGWRADGGAFAPNISPSDPYWNTVLDKAQAAYGDPGMRFNTAISFSATARGYRPMARWPIATTATPT